AFPDGARERHDRETHDDGRWQRTHSIQDILPRARAWRRQALLCGTRRTKEPVREYRPQLRIPEAGQLLVTGAAQPSSAALDDSTGDSRAGVPGGICLLIVRARVNHDRRSVRVE